MPYVLYSAVCSFLCLQLRICGSCRWGSALAGAFFCNLSSKAPLVCQKMCLCSEKYIHHFWLYLTWGVLLKHFRRIFSSTVSVELLFFLSGSGNDTINIQAQMGQKAGDGRCLWNQQDHVFGHSSCQCHVWRSCCSLSGGHGPEFPLKANRENDVLHNKKLLWY